MAKNQTTSIDNWECPHCGQLNEFEEVKQLPAARELSGHSDIQTCKACGQNAMVSLSVEFTAVPTDL